MKDNSCRHGNLGRPTSASRRSESARGPLAAAAGHSAGARRTTASPSGPSAARSTSASTGSIRRPSTGSGTPRRSSRRRSRAGATSPYVFTKCSQVWDDAGHISHNLEPASIRREVEESLRRLRVDVIDLYQIHWPAQPADGPSPGVEGAWRTLIDLQRAGKVRHIGVSNFNVGHLERAEALAPVGSLQPPYSMLRRNIEQEILPYCQHHNIGVIVYSPMLSGMLSGSMTRERIAAMPADDWRKTRNREFQEPRLTRNLRLVERLRAIGSRHGRSPGEVAIAWTLRHPAVTGAIVGARSAAQVDGFIGAAEFRLGADELQEIEQALAEAQAP